MLIWYEIHFMLVIIVSYFDYRGSGKQLHTNTYYQGSVGIKVVRMETDVTGFEVEKSLSRIY